MPAIESAWQGTTIVCAPAELGSGVRSDGLVDVNGKVHVSLLRMGDEWDTTVRWQSVSLASAEMTLVAVVSRRSQRQKTSSSKPVTTAEISSDPRQPALLEKKNIP